MFSKKRSRFFWILSVMAIFAVMLAACGDDDDDDDDGNGGDVGFETVTIEAGDTIKIGISSVLSGDLESLGLPIAQAAELAGMDATIEGFAVEFIRRDDLCTAEGGPSAATQLIDEGVVAVIGPICSAGVAAAQEVYERAGIPHITPSATAVSLVEPARGSPYATFFRIPTSDGVQGVAQAEFALGELAATSVYIVHDTDVYGDGLATVFERSFTDGGGEVLGKEGYERQTTDFAAIVTNIENAAPDLVYHAGFFAEATPFIQQLRAAMPDVLFLSGDGVRDDEFLAGAGDDAEGAYLSLPTAFEAGGPADAFAAAFEAEYGEAATDSPFTFEAYDAATAIVMALQEAAELDGDALVVDLEALTDAIRGVSFDGASGPIAFGANGDNSARADAEITLYVVEGGEFVTVD